MADLAGLAAYPRGFPAALVLPIEPGHVAARCFFCFGSLHRRNFSPPSELSCLTNPSREDAPMTKQPKTLDDLFHDTLKDIYFAEKKIVATLPKMAKAAQHPQLESRLREASEGDRGPRAAPRARLRHHRQEAGGQDLRRHPRHHRGRRRRSSKSTRAPPRSMPACSRPRKPSSITRSRATARCAPGPKSLASATPPRCCKRRSTKRRPPTRR